MKKSINEESLNQDTLLKIMEEFYIKGETQQNVSPQEFIREITIKLQPLLPK